MGVVDAGGERRCAGGRGGLAGMGLGFPPPMNVTKDDVDEFVRRLDKSFAELAKAKA